MGSRTGFTDDRATAGDEFASRSVLREYSELILVCVIFVLFLRAFVFQQSEIPSASMEDTVVPGDYIVVNRFAYAPTTFDWERRLLPIREISRGDVVVFKHPPGPERDFIKRVAGLPGDTVELRAGYLWVNQRQVDEPWVNPLYRRNDSFGPIVVAADEYFVLGDHRNLSADSREWGAVPADLLKGQAVMILFSTMGPSTDDSTGQVTIKSIGRKMLQLVFRARWDRALRIIH